MEVLRPGDKNREISCHRCNALLRFEPSDVQCINTACYYAGETWDPRYILTCPECGEIVYVDKLISENTKEAAARKLKGL